MHLLPKSVSVFLLFFFITHNIFAQQIYNLDLQSSIDLAKEKSKTMLMLKQNLKKASFDLKAATSSFKTHVTMDMVLPQYTETISQFVDTAGVTYYPDTSEYNEWIPDNKPAPSYRWFIIYTLRGCESY